MSKKALTLIFLAGIILSACSGQTPQVVESSTPLPATAITAPPATKAPDTPTSPGESPTVETPSSNTPLPVSTPTPFEPDNAADCINNATFVSDVTIPDNTPVAPGESFTKTWRVRNTGTCIWWSGYTLSHYSENAMSAPASVPLPVTNPGETADISVNLVAPTVAGTYQGNFVIKNPAGLPMQIGKEGGDSRLWVIITVTGTATSVPATGTSVGTTTTPGSGTPGAATSGTSISIANCAYTIDVPRTEQVAVAINNYRAQNNLVAYTVNGQLSQAAQRHAADMACNKLTYHEGSDGSTPQTRVADTGYVASDVTENVLFNYPPYSPDQAVTWWKLDQTDPTHNKNLISTEYTEIGVGYAFFDNFGYYVVVFAKP